MYMHISKMMQGRRHDEDFQGLVTCSLSRPVTRTSKSS